jgi:hypothetical protein
MFACYERQFGRRLDTGTFAISEEKAHELVFMATQIRSAARAALRRVGNEAVPTMLCDLMDGLAQGIIDELSRKLNGRSKKNGQAASSPSAQPRLHGARSSRGTPADSRLDSLAARAHG